MWFGSYLNITTNIILAISMCILDNLGTSVHTFQYKHNDVVILMGINIQRQL